MSRTAISVIFLTYNRSDLLKLAVESLNRAFAQLPDLTVETIVSDDASKPEHQAVIRALPVDTLLIAEKNAGLSSSHNRAQRACKHDLILSIQDDWEFTGDPKILQQAAEILKADPEIGVVNLRAPIDDLPHTERRLADGTRYVVFENDGHKTYQTHRPYTDRPHLKRKGFIRDLGDYREDIKNLAVAELEFQQRVACQQRWKIAEIVAPDSFVCNGIERTFNPAQLRARRREAFYRVPVIGPLYKAMRLAARTVRDRVARA